MVRRSHVTMEFICFATRNRHYASDKLVAIRYNAYDKGALPRTKEMLCGPRQIWACSTGMCVRLGCAHNRGSSVTEVFCCDNDFSVATYLDSDEKKKKDPRDLGPHSIVRFMDLQLNVYLLTSSNLNL